MLFRAYGGLAMRYLLLLVILLVLYLSWDATDLHAEAFWPGAGAPMLFMLSLNVLVLWLVVAGVRQRVRGHSSGGFGGDAGSGYGSVGDSCWGGDGGGDGGGDAG